MPLAAMDAGASERGSGRCTFSDLNSPAVPAAEEMIAARRAQLRLLCMRVVWVRGQQKFRRSDSWKRRVQRSTHDESLCSLTYLIYSCYNKARWCVCEGHINHLLPSAAIYNSRLGQSKSQATPNLLINSNAAKLEQARIIAELLELFIPSTLPPLKITKLAFF